MNTGQFAGTVKVVLALMASAFLVACSSKPTVPEGQRFSEPDYNYVIGPGDTMEIFVWGNEELTTTAIVRPDGKFTTRLVEDLEASGMTPTQLARAIEEAYGEYVRQPVVSVIVNGFVGVPEQQIRVVGEAAEPRGVPFRQHMTLLDLMIAVGGMTEFAAGNKSVLVRTHNGQQTSYGLRLDDLLRDGDISANMALMPGDIVIISESWF
ncbi:XrtA/PEP-CTERM system exopolysaccharide export protein [Congregibacter litoralis]|uniref:Putative polysaccharide export protein, PEP-CTERM sytem-associated n=1 Tax=Congregibacter litoralis KT71 TaxID=314285 RepID=A4A533_9GAMM|nr:XrtA/PEP-CTERM system exopolysaccharide export protein [Congregibacter litoralis]EAQ98904.2 putative polysaccharide export protein, PEP-CTERM sytem-associated [Congregibacter litoralis KT71]